MIDEEKYNHSLEVLRLASQMSEQYYKKPLLITYSGGKDSDVRMICSNCGEIHIPEHDEVRCPYCGAIMGEEATW